MQLSVGRRAWARARSLQVLNSTTSKLSLHVCTGKTCRKQGSPQILKFAQDLGLEDLQVDQCGCLGNCGKGPNMIVLPDEVYLRHVCTPSDLVEIMRAMKVDVPEVLLQATQLRLAGNELAMSGDLQGASTKYTQGLALNPSRGQHMLYSNLSGVQLQLNNKEAALEAATAAVACAPKGFHMAYIRLVDALYALGRYQEAAAAVQEAVKRDHTFKSIPEFKVIQGALKQQKQPIAV